MFGTARLLSAQTLQQLRRTSIQLNRTAQHWHSRQYSISREHEYVLQKTGAAKSITIMESAVSGTLARDFITGPLLVRNKARTLAHSVEKAFQTEQFPGKTGQVAANLMAFLKTDTTRSFVSFTNDLSQEPCWKLFKYIQIKFFESGYILPGLLSELKHQDVVSHYIIKAPTYTMWLQRTLNIEEVES